MRNVATERYDRRVSFNRPGSRVVRIRNTEARLHGGAGPHGRFIFGSSGMHQYATPKPPEGGRSKRSQWEQEASSGARPRRILIVEDEAIIAMGIEDLLLDLGHEVVGIAMNAEGALAAAAKHRPDLITMDINPGRGRDGISAAIEIFERLGIQSIFISAYGGEEPARRAEPAQPFGWVSKPIDRSILTALLAKICRAEDP